MSNLKTEVGLGTLGGVEPNVEVITLDSKDIGKELNGRRLPEALPEGSFQKLPDAFEWAIKKLDAHPELVAKISTLLSGVVTHLGQSSINFELFTQGVRAPKGLDLELMKIIGFAPDAMKRAAIEVGFSIKNAMHMDSYYIVLSFLYYYGCRTNNSFLRQLCLTMICVKLYRGRIYKYWKNGFDEVTVRYVMSNRLRTTNIAKLYPNTFNAIITVWAPRLDAKYSETVKKHPAHPLRGIPSILIAGFTRIEQAYFGLAAHYYSAFDAGYKTGSNKTTDDQMVERNSLSHIQLLSDNVYNSVIYTNHPVSDMDRKYIQDNLKLSPREVLKFEEYIKKSEYADEIKETVELFLQVLKAEKPQDVTSLNVTSAANQITNARAKNQVAKLKDKIDNSIRIVYGNNILGASPAQALKLRKCYVLLFLLKIKQAFTKQPYYFERKSF